MDRPREEWLEIPVPAIVAEDTFARVQQRLDDNKRFAARNTKVPSLLQGLAACSACGYGYYRTSTTDRRARRSTTTGASARDDYRYRGRPGLPQQAGPRRLPRHRRVGPRHRPARRPGADPRRDRQAAGCRPHRRPGTRQRKRLEPALAKATASITAMIEAFQEQLITIDELRDRMPAAARPRGEPARPARRRSPPSSSTARPTSSSPPAWRTSSPGSATNAATATVAGPPARAAPARQGRPHRPRTILIRHSIPTASAPATSQHDADADTEDDPAPSSPLRWGRRLPLLANIYLSVLDRHFARIWDEQMTPAWRRQYRRRTGRPNFRLVRYADDFVVLVHGTRSEAEALKTEIAALLADAS